MCVFWRGLIRTERGVSPRGSNLFFSRPPGPEGGSYRRIVARAWEQPSAHGEGSLVFGWPRSQLSLSRPSAVSSSLPGPAAVCLVNTSTLLVMSRCDEQRILGVMPSILLCIPPNDGGECCQRMRMRQKRNAHSRFTLHRRFSSRSSHFFGPTPFPYIYYRLYVNDSELSGCSCLGSLVFGWPRSQLSLSRPSAVSSSLPGPAAVCLLNNFHPVQFSSVQEPVRRTADTRRRRRLRRRKPRRECDTDTLRAVLANARLNRPTLAHAGAPLSNAQSVARRRPTHEPWPLPPVVPTRTFVSLFRLFRLLLFSFPCARSPFRTGVQGRVAGDPPPTVAATGRALSWSLGLAAPVDGSGCLGVKTRAVAPWRGSWRGMDSYSLSGPGHLPRGPARTPSCVSTGVHSSAAWAQSDTRLRGSRDPPLPLRSAGRARGDGTEKIMYTTLPNVFSRVLSCARRLDANGVG